MSYEHEWLDLIDISGPFLAVPVLKNAFPQGLDQLDPKNQKKPVRQAYDEWREALDEGDPKIAHDFINVLVESESQPSVILVVSHMPFVSYFLEEVHVEKKSMLFDTSSVVIVDYALAVGAGNIESIYHPV